MGFTGLRVYVFSPRKMARTMSSLKIMGRSVMVRLHPFTDFVFFVWCGRFPASFNFAQTGRHYPKESGQFP